ncbi:fibroblast growth factor-binding protein 3 [Nannospalax galili]|uniref:fibroblast growth factor-binding protein 3 n=1 Tax=Nannospalax galili TaxID=1026970 RepID=UPI0004ED164A|nr:fibroblast growth factor-binding protein 3 [Nannospalax galili]
MSPLGPRASLSLLLLLEGCVLAAARRDKGAAGRAATPARGPAGGSSGRFVSPEQHACIWQLLPSVPGALAGAELAVRCQGADGAPQLCAYRGEPERCAAYPSLSALYWKQVLGALRRKRRPCLDPAPLHARLCARRKGPGAELRLAAVPGPATRPSDPPRLRAGSRKRLPHPQPSPSPSAPRAKSKAGGRKPASEPSREQPRTTPPNPDGLDQNAELTQTYCAEKWHSVCNFFVNFWNG